MLSGRLFVIGGVNRLAVRVARALRAQDASVVIVRRAYNLSALVAPAFIAAACGDEVKVLTWWPLPSSTRASDVNAAVDA